VTCKQVGFQPNYSPNLASGTSRNEALVSIPQWLESVLGNLYTACEVTPNILGYHDGVELQGGAPAEERSDEIIGKG
jgi:hypothetical protein